jgi:hypothetical protein
MHNNILEYASIASISTVMTMPFHGIPFQKKVFEEVISSNIIKPPPPVLTRQSIKRKREKNY